MWLEVGLKDVGTQLHAQRPGLHAQDHTEETQQHTPVVPALRKGRQEDQEGVHGSHQLMRWVKVLVAKPDSLVQSLGPTKLKGGRKKTSHKSSSNCHTYTYCGAPQSVRIQSKYNVIKKFHVATMKSGMLISAKNHMWKICPAP